MANTLATCSILAKESLAILQNMLAFTAGVNRDWEDEFSGNQARGYSAGTTISIKKPPRYTYRAGRVAVPQSTVESTVPLTLSQGGVDLSFLSVERTLSLQQMEQKLQAAVATVANEIDRQGLQMAYQATANATNVTSGAGGATPATALAAVQIFTDANRRLDEMAAPRDKMRQMIAGPALNAALVSGLSGLFNSSQKVSAQYGSGLVVDSLGMNFGMDQNVATHTNGTQVVTGTAVAAGLSGASIACVGLGGTITKGTVINFPGVFAVNPQSRQSTGVLMDFVVTSDLAAAAVALPISPALTASGAFQNVSNVTTAANFTIKGAASTAYQQNLVFHKDAYTLACVPLWKPPKNGVLDSATETENGLSVRVIQFYDGVNDNAIFRLDVLFGWAATYPELGNRIYLA
jgi:hypothetical protein